MSRCVPFPPPGWSARNGMSDEDFLKLLKRDKAKAKKERRRQRKRNKRKKKKKKKEEKLSDLEEGEIRSENEKEERLLDLEEGEIRSENKKEEKLLDLEEGEIRIEEKKEEEGEFQPEKKKDEKLSGLEEGEISPEKKKEEKLLDLDEEEKKKEKKISDLEEEEIKAENEIVSSRRKHHKRKKAEEGSDNQGITENATQAFGKTGINEELQQPKTESLYYSFDLEEGENKKEKKLSDLEEREIRAENEIVRSRCKHHKRKKAEEGSDNQGITENATQAFVKSGVTEELQLPKTESLYYFFDNIESQKKKRQILSPNELHTQGSIFDIDSQLQKHEEPQSLFMEHGCFGSTIKFVLLEEFELAASPIEDQCPFTNGGLTTSQGLDQNVLLHSSFQRIECDADDEYNRLMTSSLSESSFAEIDALYKKLLESWDPPPMQPELSEPDHLEWLLKRSRPKKEMTEKSGASNDGPTQLPKKETTKRSDASNDGPPQQHGREMNENFDANIHDMQPRARYLPKAGIYAMPYVLPF